MTTFDLIYDIIFTRPLSSSAQISYICTCLCSASFNSIFNSIDNVHMAGINNNEIDEDDCQRNYNKGLKLYSSFISQPSFSVRIALNLKGLDHECKPINLLKGEHCRPEFERISPMAYVPALSDSDLVLAESLAILLYLEEKYPQNPLLPLDLKKKTLNYQVANIVSSTIQPTLRMPILWYMRDNVGPVESGAWVHNSLRKGFTALEILLKDHVGKYATGDEICLADVLLAPQVIGVRERYKFDMSDYPLLSKLSEAYRKIPAIQNALPENQPDFFSLEGLL